MTHELPELGYGYEALEPFIDKETMEIHHSKHHQGYVDKLNAALENSELKDKDVDELISDLSQVPEDIKTAVQNNGGGHSNHSFFWKLLKKDVDFLGEVSDAINDKWTSYEKFKEEFTANALSVFGSGWGWLVVNNGELELMKTANQDSPISEGKIPVLGIDMWEHSRYLLYKNRTPDYVEAFFNIINWEQVEENYQKAKGDE